MRFPALLNALLTCTLILLVYVQYLTHFIHVPRVMQEMSLRCSHFEQLPEQMLVPHGESSLVQERLKQYGELLRFRNLWSLTNRWIQGSGYINHDLIATVAFGNAVESIDQEYYLGAGSTTVVYGIPGCNNWAVKYRRIAPYQEPRPNGQEIDLFLQQKGIVPKTRCFQNTKNKDVGAEVPQWDICVQERAMPLKSYWRMNPDKQQDLIKALMIYYSRKDRYNVMYEGYDDDQLGVYNDASSSNLECGTTLSVRLLDTDGATIGDWRHDCEERQIICETADFVYYPQNVKDTYGYVGRILARITGENAKGYGIKMQLNGAGEWELQKYKTA